MPAPARDSAAAAAKAPPAAPAPALAPVDTARGVPRTFGLKPPGRFDAPRWVMLRSAVMPGWGQFHNGSWLKALAIATVEVALGYQVLEDLNELDRLNAQVEAARAAGDAEAELVAINAYNDRQSTLYAREWLLGGSIVYSMVDAYVDAHFRNFDFEFKHDPALPNGVPVKPESRLSIGWRF